MDLELRSRRALITGSTAGIGFATARLLAEKGAPVVGNGRTEPRVATMEREFFETARPSSLLRRSPPHTRSPR